MIIKKVILQNFESHENTTINFCDNFNCIVGPSNSGKTAIFNAILFALFNEWNQDFIRKGSTYCKVIVETDKFILERCKGDKDNYVIINMNDRTYRFSNFGRDYPDELKSLIGLSSLEDFLPYVAPQDSNSFLIYDSSTLRSSYINKISGLTLLEETLERVIVEIRKLDNEIRESEKKKSELISEYKKISKIDLVERLFNDIEKLEKIKNKKVEVLNNIIFYKSKLDDINNRINKLENIINELKIDFDEYLVFCDEFLNLYKLIDNFYFVNMKIEETFKEYNEISKSIEVVTNNLIDLLNKNKICPLCGSYLTENSIDFIFKDVIK